MNIHDVITDLGGRDQTAALCGVSADAIKKWVKSGRVPSKHWPDIVAETKGGISYESLAALSLEVPA